jgi:predicted dehydrogenase
MASSSKLKIGVIGLGIGMAHLRELSGINDVEVVAVCDFNEALLKEAKVLAPGAIASTNAADLVKSNKIDALVIASFDNHHAEQTITALKSGKHVFVEKPLCLNNDELTSIVKAYNQCSGLLSSNLILRTNPRFIELKSRVAKNELGDLFNIESGYWWGRIQKLREGWRGQIENYSVTLGGGVHMIDLSKWLMGSRILEVSAVGVKKASKDFYFKTPDTVISQFVFENGAIGRMTANCGCVHPHFHEFNVFGTNGTFLNREDGGHYFFSSEQTKPTICATQYRGTNKAALLNQFIRAIVDGSPLLIPTQNVFDCISACLAIDQSIILGSKVKVNYIEAQR